MKRIKEKKSLAVIGGGISAVQACMYAQSLGLEVYLISRHPLRKHQFDSDPSWLGPKNMTKFLSEKSYVKRRELITKSRNRGSVPPELFSKVSSLIRNQRIQFEKTEVSSCQKNNKYYELTLASQKKIKVDEVILATGFEPLRPGGQMLTKLLDRYKLPVSNCGFPLVDSRLKWHKRIYVAGSLAELEIGPVAKNIAGAREAARRILS